MIKSYDIVGDIIILNKRISKKQANELLKKHKHVKTVAYKSEPHKGKYRLKKVKILAGENSKVTIHKENKISLRLDIEKCYFTPRLSEERKRICSLIKSGERILVLFSGIAPYPLVISRNSLARDICAIESNPIAHKYAEENVKLNKINNIKLFKGDVRKVLPKIKEKFDRIIMPLPKNAEDFLPIALNKIKKKGIIHLYTFLHENEIKNAKKILEGKIKRYKILRIVKCGKYSPRVFRVCLDIKVLSKSGLNY